MTDRQAIRTMLPPRGYRLDETGKCCLLMKKGFAPKRERVTPCDVKGWSNALTRNLAKPSRECLSRRSRRTVDQFLRSLPPSRHLDRHPPSMGEERKTQTEADTRRSLPFPAVSFERAAPVIPVLPKMRRPESIDSALTTVASECAQTLTNESGVQNCRKTAGKPLKPSSRTTKKEASKAP
jgi:hypothetical protein